MSNSSNQRSTCTFDITAETLHFYSNNHQIPLTMSSEASTSNAAQQARGDNEHLVISDDPEHVRPGSTCPLHCNFLDVHLNKFDLVRPLACKLDP